MLDLERLKELRDEIGPEDFDDVIEMFFQEVSEALEALDPSNHDDMKRGLHFLKGSSLNIGMSQVSAMCLHGEKQIMAGDTSVDIDAIRTAFESSRRALSQAEF